MKIEVENSVESLGTYFFEDCENLTSIDLGSICGFNYMCISNCPKLTKLVISFGVSMWSTPIISDCENLTVYLKSDAANIYGSLRAGNVKFVVTDTDSEFIIENGVLRGYAGNAKTLVIPEGVRRIDDGACSYLMNTEEIVLPRSVKTIRPAAFEHCPKLKKIQLPSGLTELGSGVFNSCTSLSAIVIPSNIHNIPSEVFNECVALKTVYLPSSIKFIQSSAFSNCSGLETVYFEGTEEDRAKIDIRDNNEYLTEANWIYESAMPELVPELEKGDINEDGVVDGRDVIRLMDYLSEEMGEAEMAWIIEDGLADLNSDGQVNEECVKKSL